MNDFVLATCIATFLSVHGLRRKSLSRSGASTAFFVGIFTMAGGLRAFGIVLIVFYLIASRATKHGKELKAKLEEGYVDAGYRTGWQVLCNSVWAVIAITLWNATHVGSSIQAGFVRFLFGGVGVGGREYSSREWCVLSSDGSELVYFVLGHFGCCLGDTMASELGILSRSKPRLVTSWKKVVPPGTNGGMTLWGTSCSVMGGGIVGGVMGLSLLVENKACEAGQLTWLVFVGMFAGGVGSLMDSILGATVQRTVYDADRGKIMQSGPGVAISGYDWLSNNQVNLFSSLLTAILTALIFTSSPSSSSSPSS